MSVNWQDIAFSFLGGLGLFLFSIKYMGDGLQQAAGDKLRFYIDKLVLSWGQTSGQP